MDMRLGKREAERMPGTIGEVGAVGAVGARWMGFVSSVRWQNASTWCWVKVWVWVRVR